MWPSLFKVLGGSLLTFALVWALVLGWWQSNDHQPGKLEIGLYLAALPLALVGGYLLLRGFIDHLKTPVAIQNAEVPGAHDDDPLAAASGRTAAAERAFTFGLVDAFVLTAGGVSVDDTLAAVDSGKRPEPVTRLLDDSGFPVFAAEVAELDVAAMIEHFLDAAEPLRQLSSSEQAMRGFSLLDPVIEASRDRLQNILELAGEPVRLHVVWIVPPGWRAFDPSSLKSWLQMRLSLVPEQNSLEVSLVSAADEIDALRALDEISLHGNRAPAHRDVALLLGAVSSVDELTVEEWANARRLFSAQHQERQIPGEGAVALLLASPPLIAELELDDSIAISRLSVASRDKPVDAGGRVTGKLIDQLITGLLDVTGIAPSSIKSVMLTTDHRANYLAEALEGLGQSFEHLDPIKDCPAIGATVGELSPISGFVALACARARVLATGESALCISNQHPRDRGVLVAMPMSPQPVIETSSN